MGQAATAHSSNRLGEHSCGKQIGHHEIGLSSTNFEKISAVATSLLPAKKKVRGALRGHLSQGFLRRCQLKVELAQCP